VAKRKLNRRQRWRIEKIQAEKRQRAQRRNAELETLVADDLGDEQIGTITSGGPSPSLGRVGIGMGYISGVTEGDEVLIAPNPRKQVRAVVVRAPFV